jgi:hypothetical protein
MRKRKKEDGRPKGTFKKFRFEETKIGFFLKYEVPVVYDIIMELTLSQNYGEPPLLLIQMVCRGSSDPSLKKAKYFRYLEEYASFGLCCKRAKQLTAKRKAYYEGIRKKKMEKFILQNRGRIEGIRKLLG